MWTYDPKGYEQQAREIMAKKDKPLLIMGPPGCGKTALLRKLCGDELFQSETMDWRDFKLYAEEKEVLAIERIDRLHIPIGIVRYSVGKKLLVATAGVFRTATNNMFILDLFGHCDDEPHVIHIEWENEDHDEIVRAHGLKPAHFDGKELNLRQRLQQARLLEMQQIRAD